MNEGQYSDVLFNGINSVREPHVVKETGVKSFISDPS